MGGKGGGGPLCFTCSGAVDKSKHQHVVPSSGVASRYVGSGPVPVPVPVPVPGSGRTDVWQFAPCSANASAMETKKLAMPPSTNIEMACGRPIAAQKTAAPIHDMR